MAGRCALDRIRDRDEGKLIDIEPGVPVPPRRGRSVAEPDGDVQLVHLGERDLEVELVIGPGRRPAPLPDAVDADLATAALDLRVDLARDAVERARAAPGEERDLHEELVVFDGEIVLGEAAKGEPEPTPPARIDAR